MSSHPCARTFALLLCMLGAASVHAAEPIPETQPVSQATPNAVVPAPEALRTALREAWTRHPAHRATEAQLAASRARLDAAGRPLYNPEIEGEAEDEGEDRTRTVGVSLTLDVRGKRRARRAAAAARVDLATAEARLRRLDFARQWFIAWADLRSADARIRVGERRIALVTRFAELAERQFAADDISGLDRDVAQLARDEAQAEQAGLLAERAEAAARFRALGGDPATVAAIELPPGVAPAHLALGPIDVERLPQWQVASANARALEREIAVADRNRRADPTIGVRTGRIDFGPTSDNVVGVFVSVPLHIRNNYRAEVVAARADAEVAEAEADRIRAELDAERVRIEETYAATREAWTQWQSSRGTDIERRTGLLERLWREGEISTSDYLLQLKQTLDTALAGAELEARLWRSYAEYLAAGGQLESWAGLESPHGETNP